MIAAPREQVFRFLEDLENHWLITDRFVRVLSLDGPPGRRTGGRVRIRAPFGLSRIATTRVEESRPPAELIGSARIGEHTRADVRWTLEETGAGTGVTLTAGLTAAGLVDRILWLGGGRVWMKRRLARAVRGLEARFGPS